MFPSVSHGNVLCVSWVGGSPWGPHSQLRLGELGLWGGEGMLRKVGLLICKMGTANSPQTGGVSGALQ